MRCPDVTRRRKYHIAGRICMAWTIPDFFYQCMNDDTETIHLDWSVDSNVYRFGHV